MLEQLRRNSRNFIIWILFAIIILVFIISFGPQANAQIGCGESKTSAIIVDGNSVGKNSWAFYVKSVEKRWIPSTIVDKQKYTNQRHWLVLDLLLRRELLAQAAEAQGFRVSDDVLNNKIANGEIYILGERRPGRQWYFRKGKNGTYFDVETLRGLVSQLGLSKLHYFVDQQRREVLADMMRRVIADGVRVADEEVKEEFIYDNTKAALDFVKFNPVRYGRLKFRQAKPDGKEWHSHAWLNKTEVEQYLKFHEKTVKTKYDADAKTKYAAKERVLARYIFIEKSKPKPKAKPKKTDPKKSATNVPKKKDVKKKDTKKAGTNPPATVKVTTKPGAKKPAAGAPNPNAPKPAPKPTVTKTPDPNRTKAQELQKKLAAGGDFAKAARDNSDDVYSNYRDGALYWRPVAHLGKGLKVSEAAKKLKVNEVSKVIEDSRGYHIIRIEKKSKEKLGYDDVKLEIAEDLGKVFYRDQRASADAKDTLAKATAGKKLSELYKRGRPQRLGGGTMPRLTPEILRRLQAMPEQQRNMIMSNPQLLQLMMGKRPPPRKRPIKRPPMKLPIKKAPGKKPPAKKAPGKKSGQLLPVYPAGSAPAEWRGWLTAGVSNAKDTKKAGAPTPKAKPPVAIKKPKAETLGDGEVLPPFTQSKDPQVQEYGNFNRNPPFGGPLAGKDLTKIFETLGEWQLSKQVYKYQNSYVVVQVTKRIEPNMEQYKEDAPFIRSRRQNEKADLAVRQWVAERCLSFANRGKVKVSKAFLNTYSEDNKKKATYKPCTTLVQ